MPDQDKSAEYSGNNPAFVGEYEFDLTFEMLGRRITARRKPITSTRHAGSILI